MCTLLMVFKKIFNSPFSIFNSVFTALSWRLRGLRLESGFPYRPALAFLYGLCFTAFLALLPTSRPCPYTSLSTGFRLAWRLLYFLVLPFFVRPFRGFLGLRFPGLFYGLPIRPSRPKAPYGAKGKQSPAKRRGFCTQDYACGAVSVWRAAKNPCLTFTMRLFSPFFNSF